MDDEKATNNSEPPSDKTEEKKGCLVAPISGINKNQGIYQYTEGDQYIKFD